MKPGIYTSAHGRRLIVAPAVGGTIQVLKDPDMTEEEAAETLKQAFPEGTTIKCP